MNSSPQKENVSVTPSEQQSTKLSEMTSKTVEEISHRIEEVFAKLQRNLEHNTRVFQEKSQGLLSRIDQAEDQLRKVLSQLETAAHNVGKNKDKVSGESAPVVPVTESIALSEESTKLEADETTEN